MDFVTLLQQDNEPTTYKLETALHNRAVKNPSHMGARMIFSSGGQIKGLGTKVPQWGPRNGAPVEVWALWGEDSRSRHQVVKIMHK